MSDGGHIRALASITHPTVQHRQHRQHRSTDLVAGEEEAGFDVHELNQRAILDRRVSHGAAVDLCVRVGSEYDTLGKV